MALITPSPYVPREEDATPLPKVESLNKKSVSRLKWYFQNSTRAMTALPDETDLELSVAGFIQRVEPSWQGSIRYCITPRGERMVHALREQSKRQRAPHHELGSHLAQWLQQQGQGRLTWENASFDVESTGGVCTTRPDVFSMSCTLNPAKRDAQVHEVKVSRADFLADVKNPAKRAAYFCLAPRVFYATPAGLITLEEVPPECGWVEQGAHGVGWSVRKKAPKKKGWQPWTERMWLTLVLRSHPQLKLPPDKEGS